jgi:hypothetical protein
VKGSFAARKFLARTYLTSIPSKEMSLRLTGDRVIVIGCFVRKSLARQRGAEMMSLCKSLFE